MGCSPRPQSSHHWPRQTRYSWLRSDSGGYARAAAAFIARRRDDADGAGLLLDACTDHAIVVARFLEEQQQFGAAAQALLRMQCLATVRHRIPVALALRLARSRAAAPGYGRTCFRVLAGIRVQRVWGCCTGRRVPANASRPAWREGGLRVRLIDGSPLARASVEAWLSRPPEATRAITGFEALARSLAGCAVRLAALPGGHRWGNRP